MDLKNLIWLFEPTHKDHNNLCKKKIKYWIWK